MIIDALARGLINHYQGGLPLCEQPFVRIATELKVDEARIITTIASLLESKTLSRFGPLYDAAKLGGAFTLAALQVPEDRYDAVSAQVNQFTEVAHNYRRDHALNMWFVVASDHAKHIQSTLQAIEATTRLKVYDFPKVQEFYVGLWLQLDAQGKVSTQPVPNKTQAIPYQADPLDRPIIKATQAGLALTSRPYDVIAKQLETPIDIVLMRLEHMLSAGVIRRIGLVPNHYKLGLHGNGMSVWDVPETMISELGHAVGALGFVSHAYQRPRHLPLWPYNLFAMVHGENRDQVREKVTLISQLLGEHCQQHDVLFSSAILKKTGLRLVA